MTHGLSSADRVPYPDGVFQQALMTASSWHRSHRRKGDNIPYVAHLLSVAAFALQEGVDDFTCAAALLHDSIEDVGATFEQIESLFGTRTARTVEMCSDSNTNAAVEATYRGRKLAHIVKLQQFFAGWDDRDALAAPSDSLHRSVMVVLAADKYDNMLSMTRAATQQGEAFWNCLTGGAFGMVWYYRTLEPLFAGLGDLERSPLRWGLATAMKQIEELTSSYAFDAAATLAYSQRLEALGSPSESFGTDLVWPEHWGLADEYRLAVSEALRRSRELGFDSHGTETRAVIENVLHAWYAPTAAEMARLSSAIRA